MITQYGEGCVKLRKTKDHLHDYDFIPIYAAIVRDSVILDLQFGKIYPYFVFIFGIAKDSALP